MALIEKIKAIADAIRNKTGYSSMLTLDEMPDMIEAIESSGVATYDNTYILVDEDGYEIPAVLTEEEVELTATANDIRLGTVAVTDNGVVVGDKFIPPYITTEGCTLIRAGMPFDIPMYTDYCEYTKLQVLICKFNKTIANSVETDRVSIDSNVYAVNSTEVLAAVTVDTDTKIIKLGITNDSDTRYVIRYFTYKEEH